MTTTYTGRLLIPNNFGVPSPRDIAVQLGRIPRFAGATRVWPWSVLHHVKACWDVAVELKALRGSKLWLLLHDAEEVATGDIPTLWKNAGNREAQAALSARIFEAYLQDPHPSNGSGKYIDRLLLVAEMKILGPPHVLQHSGLHCFQDTKDHLPVAMQAVNRTLKSYDTPECCQYETGSLVQWFLNTIDLEGIYPYGMEESWNGKAY